MCSGPPDGATGSFAFVAAEIVHDDDITGRERGHQELFDISQKTLAIDRAIEHAGRVDAVMAKGGEERHRVPVAERNLSLQPLAARGPTPQRPHVGLGPSLINEHQSARIKPRLMCLPPHPLAGHVGPVLLAGQHGFF